MGSDMRNAWDPYRPTAENPWDLRKVGHLYRRAAFGATWEELQAGLADGPGKTLDRVLNGRPESDDFTRTSDYMATERSLPANAQANRLAAWWLHRMVTTSHPLREKLTLFWHNHFATSLAKVRNARQMLAQYQLLNRHALGKFDAMLQEISLDPAMMVWLDTRDSTKGKPNENYARELMELFSLGIGHYTEMDIREAAKAFTGYVIKDGKGTLDAGQHDETTKSFLGRTGNYKAADIVRICLEQPACPRFIARKMYRFLVSESTDAPDELIEPLAEQYRKSGFDTAGLVATIVRSNHFFSPAAMRQRIKSPVSFVTGLVRGLEGRVGSLNLADSLESLGQVLFAPPSVKGWDGGPAWLNGQTLLFRQNLALALTSTEDGRFGLRCDPVKVLAAHGKNSDEDVVDFLLALFLQGDVPDGSRARLLDYMKQARNAKVPSYWTSEDKANHRLRAVTHLVLTLPEFQLD
jgi:uncharacterized protein (DUF1800 family)